ncbi:MAG TPA: EAL domain-containing protein [Xanthobacteraceae bacterium]|nr:EAL domain-containing protein [Xanthobacteraceae bacterium]
MRRFDFAWLNSWAQTTTYLGVVMIGVIWTAAFHLANEKYEHTLEGAQRQGANIARAFAEYISRVINGTDGQLIVLRELYHANPESGEFAYWVGNAKFKNDLAVQFALTDARGQVLFSSIGPLASTIDISERPDFRVHREAIEDNLHISVPLLCEISGKLTLNLTRRIAAPDGSFGGIIIASLDIARLLKFSGSIDIGPQGAISLIGVDRVIRLRSAREETPNYSVGQTLESSALFNHYREAAAGEYWNTMPQFGNVRRLVSYRGLDDLPLIAVVAQAESDILQKAATETRHYYRITFILTAFVLLVMAFGAVRQKKLLSASEEIKRAKESLERSNRSLEQTNRRFDAALENITHGICMFDRDKRLVVCNRHYANLYRLPPELQKIGTPHEAIVAHRVLSGQLTGDTSFGAAEDKLRTLGDLPDDQPSVRVDELTDGRLIRVIRQPMEGGGWVATHEDITSQKRTELQIIHMARHDNLTGLANRAVLLERINDALVRQRRCGETFTILMLDLDRFKGVNDSLGHHIGDELLKEAARRLRCSLRETDMLARLGGDEFAIVQVGESNQREAAVALAVRVIDNINEPFEIEGHKLSIGTSIGIALAPEDGADCDDLLKKADMALYRAKADGRNGYAFFDPAMTAEVDARHNMENDLRRAIAKGEFELVYQPMIDVKTRRICGAEALLRWRHPIKGLINPAEFIALAEETGLIATIGEWALQRACMDAIRWPPHAKVAVNLSSVQFKRGNLLDVILCILVDTGLSPQRLELEITESALFENEGTNVTMMHQLKNLGISIALDDFGTGYSSLSYLTMFPFDKIKIDKSFTLNMTRNPASAAIIAAVLSLGRSLGIATTAEGVETRQELRSLCASGVNFVQGYLFGRPCAADELDFDAVYDWDRADADRRQATADIA